MSLWTIGCCHNKEKNRQSYKLTGEILLILMTQLYHNEVQYFPIHVIRIMEPSLIFLCNFNCCLYIINFYTFILSRKITNLLEDCWIFHLLPIHNDSSKI